MIITINYFANISPKTPELVLIFLKLKKLDKPVLLLIATQKVVQSLLAHSFNAFYLARSLTGYFVYF
jgi:hypothetical protein